MNLKDYIVEQLNKNINESFHAVEITKTLDDLLPGLIGEQEVWQYPHYKTLCIDNKQKLACILTNPIGQGAILIWDMGDTTQVESLGLTNDIVSTKALWEQGLCSNVDVYISNSGKTLEELAQIGIDVLVGNLLIDGVFITEKVFGSNIEELKARQKELYSKIKYNNRMRYPDDEGLQEEYDGIREKLTQLKSIIISNKEVCGVVEREATKWQEWLERQIHNNYETRFARTIDQLAADLQGEYSTCVLLGCADKLEHILNSLKNSLVNYSLFQGYPNDANLYRNLAANRALDQILVYNDCDNILKNLSGVSINGTQAQWTKAGNVSTNDPSASDPENTFYVKSLSGDTYNYPKSFDYEGKRLIISDLEQDEINDSHLENALVVDLHTKHEEILGYIKEILRDIVGWEFESLDSSLRIMQEYQEYKVSIYKLIAMAEELSEERAIKVLKEGGELKIR